MRALRVMAALSLAGAVSSAITLPAYSAPVTPLSAAATTSVQSFEPVQFRFGGWRGRGWGWRGGGWRGGGWGWGAGALAAGALIGAGIAASSPYWGDPYDAYAAYPYGPAYVPGPAFYPGAVVYRRPWRSRWYGYGGPWGGGPWGGGPWGGPW